MTFYPSYQIEIKMRLHSKVIAALLLSFTLACTQDEPRLDESIRLDVNVETAKEVEIIYSDSAIVRVKITGATLLYHLNTREPQQEFPDGVRVDFYGPDQKITGTLTGKYGIRFEAKGEVVVRDSVVWQSAEGQRLETEELIWDERQQRVYNHRFVVLRKQDEIIMGHGFQATQDFKDARVIAVTGTKSVDEIRDDFQ
jgi:LPS export ABC transporter protein LptC